MLAHLLWSLPSVCAYLLVCRGPGAFAWVRTFTIVLIMLLADFTTLKGGLSSLKDKNDDVIILRITMKNGLLRISK